MSFWNLVSVSCSPNTLGGKVFTSTWQNVCGGSFNSRFRDEFLDREAFAPVLEAKLLGKKYRHRHNHERLHPSPDYRTPN